MNLENIIFDETFSQGIELLKFMKKNFTMLDLIEFTRDEEKCLIIGSNHDKSKLFYIFYTDESCNAIWYYLNPQSTWGKAVHGRMECCSGTYGCGILEFTIVEVLYEDLKIGTLSDMVFNIEYLGEDERSEKIKLLTEKPKINIDNAMKVYLIGNDHNEFVKIGKSNNVEKRLKQLNTGSPHNYQIYATWLDVNNNIEKYLHRKYRKFKHNREWFKKDVLNAGILNESIHSMTN